MLRSPRFHRLIASSVTALLAANSMVLLVGLADNISDAAKPATELVVITNPDGSQTVVDPTTAEGERAIDQAARRGSPIATVPASESPATTTVPGQTTIPADTSTTLPPDSPVTTILQTVDSIVDDAADLIDDTVRDTTDDVDDVIDDLTDLVDGTTGQDTGGVVDGTVDQTTDTVADTVDDTTDTIVDVVDKGTDTVDGAVSDVENAVSEVTDTGGATETVGGIVP